MAYTPTNWQTGDVVTAERLNHMEDGISEGVLVVHVRLDIGQTPTYTVDVPYADAVSAIQTKPVLYQIKTYLADSLSTIECFFGEFDSEDNVIIIRTGIDSIIYHTENGIENTPTHA